ncbi:hypothetical protein AWH62_08605 [Maricaulis sp. W15]|uniref:hypothetical protein n=1 Tax=Maricaulis sp. W15 TaxID=1772333 RepID=UPI0009488CBF|nr:hypothetical protein [Maricaulis sp. W15]OLF73005.1 hypothetical protein AWH62_08605 [Maricaulis sp. W15]
MDGLTRHVTPVRAGIAVVITLGLLLLVLMGGGQAGRQRDLLALLRAAEADYAAPGLTVAEAAPELATPEAMLAFVRDRVWLQSYAGRGLSPDDVLVLRGGNSADQAILLAALLDVQGYPVRLQRADWPDADPVLGTVESDRRDSLSALYDALDVDEAAARQSALADASAIPANLRAELEQAEALLDTYLRVPIVNGVERANPDWVWVEYQVDGEWLVADPVFPHLARPRSASAYVDPGLTPIELALDLVTPGGSRQRLLDWAGRMADEPILRFLPAAQLGSFLDSAPGAVDVPAWRPVISGVGDPVAGRSFSTGGDLLPVPGEGPPDLAAGLPPAPAITQATLTGIDTADWPEVGLTVQTDTPDGAYWYAPHLRLMVDGAPVTPRILAQPRRAPQVVFITDVSPSMIDEGHLFSAGLLGRALVESMGRMESFVAVSAAGEPVLAAGNQLYFQRRDAVLAYNSGLVVRDGDDLPAALRLAAAEARGEVVFLVMTDGELGDAEAAFQAAVEALPGRVFGVVPESQTGRFQPVFDQVWALPPDDQPDATAASIRRAFGTQLEIRYTAPPGLADAIQSVELSLVEGGVAVDGAYPVPETTVLTSARLELQVMRGGQTLGGRRTLIELARDDSQEQLLGSRAIFSGGGQFALEALYRRYFAEWRVELETQLAPDAGTAGSLPAPVGPSLDALAAINGLVGQVDRLLGERASRLDPLVTLRSAVVDVHDAENADLVRGLDVLHDGHARHADGRVSPRLGLALAVAEAQVLGGPGVNAQMVDSDELVLINPDTAIPDAWPAAVGRTLANQGGSLLATADGRAGWLISRDGMLQARLFDPDAKGARARQAIAEFQRIRNMLTVLGITASGIGSPMGVSGAQLGGLVGILDTNLRLWCFSTVMLGFVTDAIETGELEADAQAQAAEGCEINPDDIYAEYFSAFGKGFITGAMGDRATDAVKGIAGGTLPAVTEALVNTEAGVLIEISGIGDPIGDAIRNAVHD